MTLRSARSLRPACLLLPTLLALSAPVHAQSLPEPSATIKGTLVLPVPVGNPLFNAYTEVLGQVDGTYQHPLYKGLGVGVGGKMTWFGVKERALPSIITSGDISKLTLFGKVQYEQYTSARTFYELNARVGTSTFTFSCPTCTDDSRRTVLHWALGVGYYIHTSDNLAFGLTLGYETDATRFHANDLGLPDGRFPGRKEVEDAHPFQNLLIGLGFSTRLRRADDEGPGW